VITEILCFVRCDSHMSLLTFIKVIVLVLVLQTQVLVLVLVLVPKSLLTTLPNSRIHIGLVPWPVTTCTTQCRQRSTAGDSPAAGATHWLSVHKTTRCQSFLISVESLLR